MNRKFRTVAAAVLLLGMASLMECCKKCECENGNDSGGGSNIEGVYTKTNFTCSTCAQFTDSLQLSGNGVNHNMRIKLFCVSDNDTSYLELDGTRIKEFNGYDSGWVPKYIAHGTHRILCYTLGTMDTVVDVTFSQDSDFINWSLPNGVSISTPLNIISLN